MRQRRYNENKKRKLEDIDNIQTEQVSKKAKKALTRKEHTKVKLYWKEKKREQRANMSAQKKRRVRERERLRYAKLKLSKPAAPHSSTSLPSTPPKSLSMLSVSAKKQQAYRVKKGLPTSPNKFAQVMGHIIMNTTPRKKASLKTIGISSSPMKGNRLDYAKAIKETMATLKGKRQDRWVAVKRCLVMSLKSTKKARNFKQMSSETGIGYKFLRRYSNLSEIKDLNQLQRKKRDDCVDGEIIAKVTDHFASSSSFVPDKKAVNKKTMESKKVLDEPVSKVYENFKEKNPNMQLSLSKFSKLRPANIQTTRSKRLYQSMCEYCTNGKLKREALNKACDRVGIPNCKVKHNSDLIAITACPKQDGEFHPMQCIRRDCEHCGVQKLDIYYEPLVNAMHNEAISWNYWTTVEYSPPGKKSSKRKTLLTNTTSITELINALKDDCKYLATHLLNACWQKNNFQELSKHVPANSVIMHLDFSENYSTFYQQEISSAHWMKNLVTVHPIVVFYNCSECGESALPVMDVLVFLSDDTTHDHHAVQTFMQETVRFLKEDREVQFQSIYEFTDGCSSQYKSRGPLADISFGVTDFATRRERHFFGSCHGKGPCDGAGGVVKTAARMAVIRGEAIITDARTMYTHMKAKLNRTMKIQNMCNHSRRHFFLVDSINRDRPERILKTSVKGTRKLHSVRGITPGVVCTRNLGCVCSNCLFGDDEACVNDAYVQAWNVELLNLQIPLVQRGPLGARRGQRVARGPRGAGRGQRGTGIGGRGARGRGARTRGGGRVVMNRGTDRGIRTRGGRRGVQRRARQSSEEGEFAFHSNPSYPGVMLL